MIPPHQRLDAMDRTALQDHDRLVVHDELFLVERGLHVVLELHPFQCRTGKRRFVLHVAGLAFRLGDIHRHISVADQFVGRFLARDQARDADAGVHRDFLTADREGRRELPCDPVGDSVGDLLILHVP